MKLAAASRLAHRLLDSLVITTDDKKYKPKTYVVGSIRREKPDIGDIDILVILKNLNYMGVTFLDHTVRVLSKGVRRWSIAVSRPGMAIQKVDIFVALESEYPYAMYHHTGSRAYNIRLRKFAMDKNWKLNQYGLYYKNRPTHRVKGTLAIKTEQQLASFLGVSYRLPPRRVY